MKALESAHRTGIAMSIEASVADPDLEASRGPEQAEPDLDATVLVVDDEPNIVTLLETWLETIGCRVVSANDGEKGVEKAREVLPDLILMDGMMPRMSGFDACRVLKSQESTRDIPLIFLTVQGEVQDVVKGLELGAHGYMTKPFKPQELLARVRSTLKIKQIQDRLKKHTQTLRKRWDWIHGALEQLPVGMLVFDSETAELLFCNERWSQRLGSAVPSGGTISQVFEFRQSGKPAPAVLDSRDEVSGRFEILLRGESCGEFELRAGSFEKNGKQGRQIVLL
jgi:DNA-binding response OmpR family regulator